MRYPPEQTAARHERILREASKLFRQRGLNGVSVPEIMKAARLTHGPFYNHFASRDVLVAETVDCVMGAMLQDLLSSSGSKASRKQFLDAYLSPKHRDNPGDGCAVAALASDVIRSPAAKVPFTRRFKDVIAATASKFTSARGERAARAEAIRTTSLIVGALILSRAVDDNELSEEILAQARAGL